MRTPSFYIACLLILALMGCGDTSGDPTAQITKLEALPTDVTPGGSTVITATVNKAVGKKADMTAGDPSLALAWGENVTFRLLTANGGQLSSVRQKTDGKGEAKTVFTAGNNLSSDTIQATLDNGMSATIVVKKTGSLVGVIISSFTASATTVTEGQTSVITAKVTDGSNTNPVLGEPVTFTMATNESGACFINAANACVPSVTVGSDAFGNAVAIYRAGGNRSAEEVHDTIRGSLANGSSSAVIVTRSAETPLSITVEASPASVTAGQASIITATVTGANNAGIVVAFSLLVNNSGATLSASSAVTDGSGKAVVTYTAGGNEPTWDLSDTVQAAVGNISSSVVITRTGATSTLSISVAASPASVVAGQVSIVTATVTGANNAGIVVTFSLPVNNSGAVLSSSAVTTDGSGKAVVTYTAGANTPAVDVADTIQATVGNNITSFFTITRTGTGATFYSFSVTASPDTLTTDTSNSVITARVTDNLGTPISGITVTFTVAGPAVHGSVSPSSSTTNSSGTVIATFTGNGAGGVRAFGETDVVTASARINGTDYTDSLVITYP